MERITILWILTGISTVPFIAWRLMLFNQLSISQAQFDFEDVDAQIVFSLWTILMFTMFEMRSRLRHERS